MAKGKKTGGIAPGTKLDIAYYEAKSQKLAQKIARVHNEAVNAGSSVKDKQAVIKDFERQAEERAKENKSTKALTMKINAQKKAIGILEAREARAKKEKLGLVKQMGKIGDGLQRARLHNETYTAQLHSMRRGAEIRAAMRARK